MQDNHVPRWAKPASLLLIGLAPMLCLADVHYQCTGLDGFRDYQIRRCAKGMESARIETPPFDVRSMESGALVLQCMPCGPGNAWRWTPVPGATASAPVDRKLAAALPPPPPTGKASASSGGENCPAGVPEAFCKSGLLAVDPADVERIKKGMGLGALLSMPK